MSPIDDELRAALQRRADVLTPSPDPLAGIERRAKRIQRNRIGGAVAASALAVTAIAAVVPALQPTSAPQRDVPRFASAQPTQDHTTDTARYALDPDAPWAYRGADLAQLGEGSLDTIEREYATKRGATTVELTPLFGQVYESSQQFELVFLAEVDGETRWGIAVSPTEAGPEFRWDEALTEGQQSLAAALPGDEVARLLVVASPEATTLEYGPDDASEFSPMAELEPGVGVKALEGDPATDVYKVTWPGASFTGQAPNLSGPDTSPDGEPATALDPAQPWEVRGDRTLVTDGQLQALGDDWALRHGVDAGQVEVQPLHVQRAPFDGGVEVVYLVRFAQNPWMWGAAALGEGGWAWYAENELGPETRALAAALPGDAGTERLLVVAAPSTGAALYAADGRSYAPMTDVTTGVYVAPIAPGDADDSFKVLDGDGDPDDPVVEQPAPDYQNAG